MPLGWEHYHDHLLRLCRDVGFKPNVVQAAFNVEGIFGLIACEMGIAIKPVCVDNNLRKGLVAVPIVGITKIVPTIALISESSALRAQALVNAQRPE